jgi:hypothetical protein
MTPSGTLVVLLLFFIFLVFPCFIFLFVLVICAFFHICMLVAIKFVRFLQMSLSSLLNNHINLFLSDNSGKKLLFILEKKIFLAKEYLLHLINKCNKRFIR